MTIKEKKEKRAGLVNQMRSVLNVASKEKRELTADENVKYNAMEADVDQIGADVGREDKLAQFENSLRDRKNHNYRPDGDPVAVEGKRNSQEYRDAIFKNYGRYGKSGLNSEHVNVLQEGADTEGGYLVPEEFETKLTEALVMADPIRAAATVIRTGSDRNIPIETDAGSFSYVGENGAYGQSDPAVGRVVLSSYKSGGIVRVSDELIQDTGFNLEAYLLRLASRRYNTLEQSAFAVGNGAAQPLGIFNTPTVGTTAVTTTTGAVSATAAITADNLMDTFHTLARAYRDSSVWLTSDLMVRMIRKLRTGVSGDLTYLWQPGLSAGAPDRILGRPIFVSDGAPAPAALGLSIVFGDMSYYTIADRLGVSLQVLKELYAANGQVGYKFSKRCDGRLTFAPAITTFTHGAAS